MMGLCKSELATRPLLYTDSIKGAQVCRDDMWAVTTEELNRQADRIRELESELAALRQQQGEPAAWWKHVPYMESLPEHEHDAVKLAVEAMVSKLYKKYLEGYSGFEGASESWLNDLLHSHLAKGDPIDVANFCIFLFANGQRTREAAPRVPEGWKLVPVEPTEEMKQAGWYAEGPENAYKDMLAAAPNACQCAGPDGQPLNQCDECPR